MRCLYRPDPTSGGGQWNRRMGADDSLEHLLRAQAFNKEFEDLISIMSTSKQIILSPTDRMKCWPSPAAIADSTKRMKVLFLIVDGLVLLAVRCWKALWSSPMPGSEHRSSSSL